MTIYGKGWVIKSLILKIPEEIANPSSEFNEIEAIAEIVWIGDLICQKTKLKMDLNSYKFFKDGEEFEAANSDEMFNLALIRMLGRGVHEKVS